MPNLYALIVTIDAYPPGIPALSGCVNDGDAMEHLLGTLFAGTPLHLLRLNNADAKRQSVIDAFRSHLGQATADDIAFFFYAGHGSQVPTGGHFEAIEPSGMNSSIVCYDSRQQGVPDLVDKDMGVLISEVTAKGAHVTTIFDSCHSASMDRGMPQTDMHESAKPAATAAKGNSAAQAHSAEMGNYADPGGAFVRKHNERKIAPRADAQDAKHYLRDPATMESAMTRAAAHPAAGASSLTLASAVDYHPDQCGRHILMSACETDETANEYYDTTGNKLHGAFTYFLTQTLLNAKDAMSYRELRHVVAAAMSGKTAPQTPKLESSGDDAMFSNLFLSLTPVAWTDFAIAGLSILTNQWELDRGAMMSVAAGARYALYPMTAVNSDLADAGKAIGVATVTSVTPTASTLQLDAGVQLDQEAQYKAVPTSTSALNHIDTWNQRLALSNPNTQIPKTALDFMVIAYPGAPNQKEMHCPPETQIELAYQNVPAGQDNRPFYLGSITNKHTATLTIALLAFSHGDYSISPALLDAETQKLAPGETVYLHSGAPIHCSVPGTAKETTDQLLLVASTDAFDATVFKLNSVTAAAAPTRSMYSTPLPQQDFTTWRIAFHTTRS